MLRIKTNVLPYLALFLLGGCSKPNESIEIKDYWNPIEEVGEGKVFVYQNQKTQELAYTEFELFEEGGKKYLLDWEYSDSERWDSAKWLIEGNRIKMVETYWPSSETGEYEMIPAEIVHQEEVGGVEIRKVKYKLPNVRSTMKSEERFVKDTVLTWKGQQVNCKVIRTEFDVRSMLLWLPILNTSNNYSYTKYFVPNVGLVKYFFDDPVEGRKEWNLIEIR